MDKIETFRIRDAEYRIILRHRKEFHEGYVDPFDVYENVLQKRTTRFHFSFWKDVEIEEVPNHVILERGMYGFSAWKSSLIEKWKNNYITAFPY